MRKLLPFLLLSLILVSEISCTKSDPQFVAPPEKPAIVKEAGELLFKVIPLSATEVKLLFQYPPGRNLLKLLLKKDTATVGAYNVIKNTVNTSANNYYAVTIQYNFDSTVQYDFKVQTNRLKDTIYQYTISKYTHSFKDAYTYRKVLPTRQNISFDITPSRNFMFIVDDSANTLLTKRLSLKNYAVDTINTQPGSLHIRAVSDSSFLVQPLNFDNRFLSGDSAALQEYNFVSAKTIFLDWVSDGYGRISRVIDNHIFVTNPIFTNGNTSLINLADKSKKVYGPSLVNFQIIRENNYDNIYTGNLIVNTQTGVLTAPVPSGASETVEYIDNTIQLAIAAGYTQYLNGTTPGYFSHLSVYRNQNKIYGGTELADRGFRFPAIQLIKNNTILFYQYYGYGTTFNVDGYYTLDLNTGKVTLIQSDDASPFGDFQLDEKRMISIRNDGIYELIKK
ncbi:hypothetical protein BH11BAC5_BH11BAC5_12450 [soil metagenome]